MTKLADILLAGTLSMRGHIVEIDCDTREDAELLFDLLIAAASVGRNPEGEDREDGLRAEHEHAVGSEADETPKGPLT